MIKMSLVTADLQVQ